MKKNTTLLLATLLLIVSATTISKAVTRPKKFVTTYPTKVESDSTKLLDSTASAAIAEFKNLTKAEKKERLKNAKNLLKEYKKQKSAGDDVSTNEILLAILCIILPPLAVYLHQGKVTNNKFWISLVLTLLLLLPGIIYSLLVVFGGL